MDNWQHATQDLEEDKYVSTEDRIHSEAAHARQTTYTTHCVAAHSPQVQKRDADLDIDEEDEVDNSVFQGNWNRMTGIGKDSRVLVHPMQPRKRYVAHWKDQTNLSTDCASRTVDLEVNHSDDCGNNAIHTNISKESFSGMNPQEGFQKACLSGILSGHNDHEKNVKSKESLSQLEGIFSDLTLQKGARAQSESSNMTWQSKSETESVMQVLVQQNEDGDTLLHLSMIHNRLDITMKIMTCLRNQDVLNIQNNLMQTVLHLAALLDFSELLRMFVVWGANPEIQDHNGNTALHIACARGNTDSIISLTKPVSVDEAVDVPYRSFRFIYFRIPQSMYLRNFEGVTCLHIAAQTGNCGIVNYLVHVCHADINHYEGCAGETILHRAVQQNNKEMVSYLLCFDNIDINARRYDGCSALNLAKGRCYFEIAEMLACKGGVDICGDIIVAMGNNIVTDIAMDNDSSDMYDDFKIGGKSI